jgi:hypothetical protein
MRPAACPRVFEAEAMRDGRLAGAELASFERHLSVCPVCSRDAQALEALAEPLRSNSQDTDELHVRRERSRLLAAFDRTLVVPERRWDARRLLLSAAGVGAFVMLAGVFWRVRPVAQLAHASSVVVHADSTAVWSMRKAGKREKVVLQRGALLIHVDHHSSAQGRLLVVLPDGELEDTGTTFTVSAQDGHTTRVAVQEGSVALRIRGQPPVAIGAGDTWIADTRPAAQACPSPATPAQPTATPRLSSPGPSVPRQRSPTPRVSMLPDPALEFRAAVAALGIGKHREAAAAFASFIVKHPSDPRAEDAAYLRVIALQKYGANSDMKGAAQEYLRRYPTGFRHADVERLSSSP